MAEGGEEESCEVSLEDLFPDGAICANCMLDEDAVAYCRQCKRLLCDECLTYHRRQVDTRPHEVLDSPRAEEVRKRYRCDTHVDKALDYFCKTCNAPICQHCQVSVCKDHEIEVSTDARKEIQEHLDRAKVNRESFVNHAESVNAVIAQNEQSLLQCEGSVNQAFEELMEELRGKRDAVLAQLRDETQRNDDKVKQQKEFIEDMIGKMSKTIESAENLLSTKKDAKLMVNRMETCTELEGRSSQTWNVQNATFRAWHLDHKAQCDYAEQFSQLIDILFQKITELEHHSGAFCRRCRGPRRERCSRDINNGIDILLRCQQVTSTTRHCSLAHLAPQGQQRHRWPS